MSRRHRLDLPMVGWLVSSGTLNVPQAAAPLLFALIAIPLTGSADSGAALVLAMTLAQVIGAVPVTRLGRRVPLLASVKVLVALRALALGGMALLAGSQAPFPLVLAGAAAAGLVGGAAFGHLRAALNQLVRPGELPRALGIAATLNEVAFALSPALAAVLGTVSPQLAMGIVVAIGAVPLVALPRRQASAGETGGAALLPSSPASSAALPPTVILWILCAVATSSTIAAIEIGAVSMAVSYGLSPAWGSIFPVALCIASVAGGIWVSVRNTMPRLRSVLAWMAIAAAGVLCAGLGQSVAWTLLGAVMVGLVLAPLGTFYSLVLDGLAPEGRRAEVFALLRTASAVGVIVASGLITLASVETSLLIIPVLPLLALVSVVLVVRRERQLAPDDAESPPTGAGPREARRPLAPTS